MLRKTLTLAALATDPSAIYKPRRLAGGGALVTDAATAGIATVAAVAIRDTGGGWSNTVSSAPNRSD